MPDNTDVSLAVNTASITQSNKNDQVVFSDNQGDTEDNGPADYTSQVHAGKQITWSARDSSSNGYTVKITNITKENAADSDVVTLPATISNGQATATVKTGVDDGTTESYSVSFRIYNQLGAAVGSEYVIDPKMKMNNS